MVKMAKKWPKSAKIPCYKCVLCMKNSVGGCKKNAQKGPGDLGEGEAGLSIGGGLKGGDKGRMGGDWRVIRDKQTSTMRGIQEPGSQAHLAKMASLRHILTKSAS